MAHPPDQNLPPDERERLAELLRLQILDTPPEERFDRLTRMARQVFRAPFALVTLIDRDRQWFKSAQGVTGQETPRSEAFCRFTILDNEALVVEDTHADPRFATNPQVTGPPFYRFYAGQPVKGPGGHRLGTICVLDHRPRTVSTEELTILAELGAMVEEELRQSHCKAELIRVVESSPEGLVTAEPTPKGWVVRYANQQFAALVGASAETLAGQLYHKLTSASDETALSNAGAPLRLVGTDGRVRLVERRVVALPGFEGAAGDVVIFHTDVTERLRNERENRLLLAAARGVTSAGDLASALRELLRLIGEETGWQCAEAWLVESDELRRAAAWGAEDPAVAAFLGASTEMRFQYGEGLPGRVWAAGRPEWLSPLRDGPKGRFLRSDIARAAGLQAGFAVPVLVGAEVVGTLSFFTDEPRAEDLHQIELVAAVTAQIGTLIQYLRSEEERRREAAAAEAKLRKLNAELEQRVALRTAEIEQASAALTREVRERTNTAEALRTMASDLEAMLQAFPDLFFRVDTDGIIVAYKAGADNEFYVPPVLFLGRPLDAVLPAAVSTQIRQGLEQLRTGARMASVEYTLEMPQGPQVFEARLVPVEGGHTVAVVRDISERVRTEATLRQTRDELARASRLKDEFLANMSHELRTPLNTILGRAELLLEEIYGPVSDRQRHSLEVIGESGKHLLALINDILDLSKIEAGKIQLNFDVVDVDTLCEGSLRLVRQPAMSRRIQLSYTNVDRVRVVVGDERRLKQVLVNLLSNAVKFTPEGGRVGLEVHGDLEAKLIRFTVWDTGIGIAEDDLRHLFQPFVQLDSELNRHHEGTGLGLALVRRLMELHKGEVAVRSAPEHGSSFTIALPWHPQAPSAPEVEGPSAASALILLGAMAGGSAERLASYFAAHGFRVALSLEAAQTIEHARALRPHVIVLETTFSSEEAARVGGLIRSDPALATTPIICLVGAPQQGAGASDLVDGPDLLFLGSVTPAELLLRVRALLI